MSKPTVVFTAPRITSGFMEDDIRLLKPYVNICKLDLSECTGFKRYTYFTQLWRMLYKDHAQVVFAYFVAGKQTSIVAIMVRLLRRRLIVLTGGVDATFVPEINWGAMGDPVQRRLFAFVMKLSDSVLPFSNSSRDDLLQYGQPKRIRTAYLGIDTSRYIPKPEMRKRRAVTAAYLIDQGGLMQKGIEPFVRAAEHAPDIEFVVSGRFVDDSLDYLRSFATQNVVFTNTSPSKEEYCSLLQSATVYVQVSAHEGFGVSLAEGMACECVPVVANRYSMPEVVGETGYTVPFNDAPALAQAIYQAMEHPEKGNEARNRVLSKFSEERRQILLREELEFVLGRKL